MIKRIIISIALSISPATLLAASWTPVLGSGGGSQPGSGLGLSGWPNYIACTLSSGAGAGITVVATLRGKDSSKVYYQYTLDTYDGLIIGSLEFYSGTKKMGGGSGCSGISSGTSINTLISTGKAW